LYSKKIIFAFCHAAVAFVAYVREVKGEDITLSIIYLQGF